MIGLNLGCGTPGTRSWHPIERDGFVNLDKSMGWSFEDGLADYADGSVDGITISHTLMYVAQDDWPFVFSEFARVLCDEGVVRITEDDATDTRSSRCGGWKGSAPAVTLTDAAMMKKALRRAGLVAHDVDPAATHYRDDSLIQQQHGDPPHVFFVEGVRMTRVLFSPHCDDESLFAAFTILRYRPRIVVCFRSRGDYGEDNMRERETRDAMTVLGGDPCQFWRHDGDAETRYQVLAEAMRDFDRSVRPSLVFAPNVQASHPDHLATAEAARSVFGSRLRTFQTYDEGGKVRAGREMEYEPAWIGQKLRALARYESQIAHPRACKFFLEGLDEWIDD